MGTRLCQCLPYTEPLTRPTLSVPPPTWRTAVSDRLFAATWATARPKQPRAFRAVLNGYQVAVLTLTTVLAQQHLRTFRERFAEYPVVVEMISRFRTAAEQREILDRVALGEVDILIGTHRILQKDVDFA